MMREDCEKNIFESYKVGMKKIDISLLQYADDTIFVGDMTINNVMVVKSILRWFELVSELKVNFHKSRFEGIGVEKEVVDRYSNILNCKVLSFLFVYLGIPIGANTRKVESWEPIISKFKKKLASWKHRHFFFSKRICHINLVLSSLPLFYMSFFKIPKGVIKILTTLQRMFLWGCEDGRKKISWVSWKKICSPKAHGGVRG